MTTYMQNYLHRRLLRLAGQPDTATDYCSDYVVHDRSLDCVGIVYEGEPMRELTTIETFAVTGRGTAYVVHVGDDPPELHELVLLDGEPREITGIERPIRNGYTALIVAPVQDS